MLGAVLIGIISDTHGYVDPRLGAAFTGVEAIVHGGDVGGMHVLDALRAIAPLHAVYGNNDEKLFFYLVLNRTQANLAMARRDLKMIEQQFYMTNPTPGRMPSQQDGQAFFPANAGHR